MSEYLIKRANLVSDLEIEKYSEFIPLPSQYPKDIDKCIPGEKISVEDLLKNRKSFISLACGPDTISHRHLLDLLPAVSKPLNIMLNKPLETLGDISLNFNRLISKTFSGDITEKSQRPIAELNILPKYTLIRIFINRLQKLIIPRMVQNQYSFPGKGTQLAVIELMEKVSFQLSLKKAVIIVCYDMSNAFCTCPAEFIIKIAERFGVCNKMKDLLVEFLNQSKSIVKMNDSKGFHRSKIFDTKRGCQQGQIGSDFIFTMLNDAIMPIQIKDEFITRIKYVDDFVDIIAHESSEICFQSLSKNMIHIKQQATSIGLKLNEEKTQIIPANIPESELDPAFNYISKLKYLGFRAEIDIFSANKYSKKYAIYSDSYANKLISELNAAMIVVSTTKNFCYSINKRLEIATNLVYSRLGFLGLAYTYTKANKWNSIKIAIKKVLKASGLHTRIHDEDLYKITTRLTPESMAIKQVIQLGIKIVDCKKIQTTRLYKFYQKVEKGSRQPFLKLFETEFEKLGYILRKKIIDTYLDNSRLLKNRMLSIKNMLKIHFLNKDDPTGEISTKDRKKIIFSNLFNNFIDNKIEKSEVNESDTNILKKEIISEPKVNNNPIDDFRVTRQHRKSHRRK